MSGWNYNVDEAPECEVVWLTVDIGGTTTVKKITVQIAIDSGLDVIAWKPQEAWPEPATVPAKPQQLTPYELWGISSSVGTRPYIDAVEKRTREIVAWEQKYEVKK
tara:strand:+ start:265 stop:582 length:318 start_codon:yes stop_codon:yes gene_type:complete